MLRFVGILLGATVAFGSAQAAPITVINGDFEDARELERVEPIFGDFSLGANGFVTVGGAGTFEPSRTGNVYNDIPDEVGTRVGFANAGATVYQTLSVVIEANTDYTLSALFGDRLTQTAGGSFGFFAGDISNIIGSQDVVFPGEGTFSLQSFTLSAASLVDFVGQQLGIFFLGGGTQLTFDNITVEAFVSEQVAEVPLPGAALMFLTGGAAFAFGRRKKAAA